jgi:hypothetical protein
MARKETKESRQDMGGTKFQKLGEVDKEGKQRVK